MHIDERRRRMTTLACALLLGALTADTSRAGVTSRRQAPPAPPDLCTTIDRGPLEHARSLQGLGDAARERLRPLVNGSEPPHVLCGIAGLAALRDAEAVAPLLKAMRDPAFEDDRYRLVRWAAFMAGGPDPAVGARLVPLLDLLDDAAMWRTTGDDALAFLGELDDARARDRLLRELDRPGSDASLDAAVQALGRQADPRARSRVSAIGQDALQGHAGNATFEQARRLGAVAFYQLTLGTDTVDDGLHILSRLAPATQEDTAAWAVQSLCEQAVRHPDRRESAIRHRARLVEALGRAGVRWEHLTRGTFPCVPPA